MRFFSQILLSLFLFLSLSSFAQIPNIDGQNPVTIDEDQTYTVLLSDLVVTDADDIYPAGFTLTVLSGTDYTFSSNDITPATNFNGTLSVNVQVTDPSANVSNSFPLQVTVNPLNDPPVITGQNAVTISEDQSRLIDFTDVVVSDPDDTYPTGFTLTVSAGTNYTFSGNTITPTANFSGTLSVNVLVNDGAANSNSFPLQVTVNPLNDPPVVTGQNAVTISEDQSLLIDFTDLVVSDPDDTYPTGFTLTVSAGTNYTFSGNTITPTANFSGTLSVNVLVNDGATNSNSFPLQVTVNPLNDLPVITGQNAVTISEDQSRLIDFTDLVVSDPDDTYPTGFTLTVSAGTNYTFSGNTITPTANFSGTLSVNVLVNDGAANSNSFPLQVTVNPLNDPPVVTGQNAVTISEDQSLLIDFTDLVVSDPDDTYPTGFTLTVSAGTNYTFSGNTITPTANFSGTLSVNVLVNDGATNSNSFPLQVTVNPLNDLPVITGQNAVTISEDQSRLIDFTDLVVSDPDDTYPTGFTLTVSAGTNYTFSGNTITPTANFSGTLSVNVLVNDGAANSNSFPLQVTVNPLNDPPVVTGQNAVTISEDQSLLIDFTDLVVSDPDDTYPTGFTLTVSAGTNYTFSGNTITPTANFSGTLSVNVLVNDGATNSNSFPLQVTVNPLNDLPVITGQNAVTISEDQSRLIDFTDLVVSDPDDTYPTGFTLTVSAGTNYTFSGNTITPTANFSGTLSVNVLVNDGAANSNSFPLQVTVNPLNDLPVITGQNAVTISEDQSRLIDFTDLVVSDPDDTYPTGFTLTVSAGTNYTFSGNTITPTANFSGTLSVNVLVNDGAANSNSFPLQVTVNPLNDLPVITGQNAVTISEDQSRLIDFTDLVVSDPDDTYPTGFTLTVSAGTNYTFSGNTITPTANFSGTLSVNVLVNDGAANSNSFPLQVTVNPLNDPPVVTGQNAVTISEDQSLLIDFTDLVVSDPDDTYPTGFTLTVSAGTNYTFSGNTITPTANFSGTLSVNVLVNDGATNSNSFPLQVTVNGINDQPFFTKGSDISISEDAGIQTVASWATFISAGTGDIGQVLTFTLSNNNTSLFSVQPSVNATTGTLTYTPAANASGVASVDVTLSDNGGTANGGNDTSPTLTFLITITPVNDRPVANNDATTTNEDTPVSINVVSNDTDIDGTVNVSSVDLNTALAGIQNTMMTVGGAFSVISSGDVTFTPNLNFSGLVTLTYTVNDNAGLTSLNGTISITINPLNDSPVANNDAASTNEETIVTANVLTNDTDSDGNGTINAATVDLNPASPGIQSSITLAGIGTFTVNSSGVVSFTPVANFNGVASTTYTVNDIVGASSNVATISITVNAINDLPVATADAATTDEDVVVTINVISNDADPDGSINAASVDLNTIVAGIQNSNTVTGGTFTVNSSGIVTYTPSLNFNGPVTLNYRVNDNEGSSSNIVAISISVNPVNDAPLANNDAVTTNEDTPVTINVVTNDTDVDGTINVSTVDLNTTTSGIQTTATISGGTLSVSTVGVVTFTPTVNFYGTATANYFINDNSGLTSVVAATITFTVNAVNDTPFASNDITSSDEDEVVTLNVVANDVDIDGSIDPATVDLNTTTGGIQNTITTTAGTFTVNSLGVVTYTPTLNFNGNATINYTVRDNLGGTSGPAIISISVNSVNSNPVANNDGATTNEDAAVSFNVVTNDSDPDGSINIATVDLNTASPGIQNTNTNASGTFVVNPSGMLTFTPILNFNGPSSITYTVNDNIGVTSNAATITVNVTSINDSPIANNDTGSGNESVAITVNVIANDTDVDGTIDPATVDLNTTVANIQNTATTAAGSWSVNAIGVVTFTSINNFNGAATLTYRVNDSGGATTGNATITINVSSINDAPVANNDAVTTNEDVIVTLNLVTNDTDEESNLSASTVDLNTATAGIQNTITTSAGVFSVNASGVLTFTPALNFNGPATNTYTVNDTGGLTSNVATITITVTSVNDIPVAVNDAATTNEDNAVIFRVTDNDTDVEGPVNVATIDLNTTVVGIQTTNTVTSVGTFSVNANGDVTFTPIANFFGTATLAYRVNDNSGAPSNVATISITVNAINDAPSFTSIGNQQIIENSPLQTITIANVSKGPLEGAQELTWFVSSSNASIVAVQPITYDGVSTTAQLKYTVSPNTSGVVTITVSVVDNGSNLAPNQNSFTTTFTVEVVEINNQPTLNAITYGPIQEDAILQDIPLTGITAGAGETQTLAVTATTDKPALFETFTVIYTPSETLGTLKIKPLANAFGTAVVTVRVQDSGSNSPVPNVNFIMRTFSLVIQPVNDLPVFASKPVETVNIGDLFTYNIKVADVEGETLTLTAPTKPTWATLLVVAVTDTAACHCNYKLTGTPPAGSAGPIAINLQVKDPGNVLVNQSYTLVVNTRPTTLPFSTATNEDVEVNIAASKFATAFVDADGNALSEIQILTLPKHGSLKLQGGASVTVGQKISSTLLSNGLVYSPISNYYGLDTINWNASDVTSYALNPSYINLIINSVNDVPIILPMETDSLLYESGSEPLQVTKIFKVQDVDNDSLMSAEVRFLPGTFIPPDDILLFTNTKNLTGNYNAESGILSIAGKAPIAEYDSAIRAIKYENNKSVSPDEGLRTVSVTVSDGKSFSESKTRLVYVYFVEVALDIPDGFTPADDSSPNNKWEILYQNDSPASNPELKDAVLKVYNKRGLLLFETSGFKNEWDGKVNGEFVPADTYFYTIDLKSSTLQTFKGTVTVLR